MNVQQVRHNDLKKIEIIKLRYNDLEHYKCFISTAKGIVVLLLRVQPDFDKLLSYQKAIKQNGLACYQCSTSTAKGTHSDLQH